MTDYALKCDQGTEAQHNANTRRRHPPVTCKQIKEPENHKRPGGGTEDRTNHEYIRGRQTQPTCRQRDQICRDKLNREERFRSGLFGVVFTTGIWIVAPWSTLNQGRGVGGVRHLV